MRMLHIFTIFILNIELPLNIVNAYAPANVNPAPPGWSKDFWQRFVSVRIPILSWTFNVRIPSQKIYISTICQNDVGKNFCCQKHLYGRTDPVRIMKVSHPPGFTLLGALMYINLCISLYSHLPLCLNVLYNIS